MPRPSDPARPMLAAVMALAPVVLTPMPLAAQTGTGTPAPRTVATETRAPFGTYLVGGDGQPLYLFTADTQGSADTGAAMACTSDACQEAWPPYTTSGLSETPPGTPGSGADHALLGQVGRADGTFVVTYNGWPLYTYARDRAGEAPAGQDVESFGGEWYLVAPDGTAIHAGG